MLLQKKQRKEASVDHRGHYLFKIDACDCLPPYEDGMAYTPELKSMATKNSVQLPLSDNTAASIGCETTTVPFLLAVDGLCDCNLLETSALLINSTIHP